VLKDWRKWTDSRTTRRGSGIIYASIVLLLVGEAGLRVRRVVSDLEWFDAEPSQALAPFDMRVAHLTPGQMRVAVVGDNGTGEQAYLTELNKALPGLEIVTLAGTLTRPHEANELSAQIAACDADLVLAVLPVCEGLAQPTETRGCFDYRHSELATLLFGEPEPQVDVDRGAPAADLESHLRGLAPQLSACRTPLNDTMRDRWQQVLASLDEVIDGCQAARIPMALVVVPAEFQVNPRVCTTLLRRYGVAAERFDVELPQRRLAGYAAERDVPLVDLLPHLRLCRQSAYQRHATALSEAGNTATATAIGGWLESRFAGQLAPQISRAR
jgi:hypothetical protein